MLYQSTCVGFGYGLMRGLFPGTASPPGQSNKTRRYTQSVTTRWPTIVDVVPIGYAFQPRLRGRLTLRRLALRRNPWTFGDSVSHTVCRYSCQHSHFQYLQRPSRVRLHRLMERSATACGGQKTDDGDRISRLAVQALQHPGDALIFVSPVLPDGLVDVTEIERIAHPHPHLIRRTDRHAQKAFELRF